MTHLTDTYGGYRRNIEIEHYNGFIWVAVGIWVARRIGWHDDRMYRRNLVTKEQLARKYFPHMFLDAGERATGS